MCLGLRALCVYGLGLYAFRVPVLSAFGVSCGCLFCRWLQGCGLSYFGCQGGFGDWGTYDLGVSFKRFSGLAVWLRSTAEA